ncbi:MAG: efflux RND transporter permease subunit [Spirochaetota bacterium]
MKLIQYFVTHRITTLMIFCGIMATGFFAFTSLPSSLLPDMSNHAITLVVRYPGQSPYKIEEIITNPLEEAISTIGGIEEIVSSSNDNEARIYITFENDAPLQYKVYELHEKIEPVRAMFPEDVNEPEIYLQGIDYSPIMVIGLSSTQYSLNKLRDIAEGKYKKALERVEGISMIEIGGGNKREIHVTADNNYCVAHGIPLHRIAEQIQKNNFIHSLGILHDPMNDYTLRLKSRFFSLEEIKNLPLVSASAGLLKRLGQIATVKDYAGKQDSLSRYNALEQVSLYIYKTSTANPIDVSQQVASILSQCSLPGVTAHITYNSAEEIQKALHNLYISCIAGMILTMLVVYIFLKNIRATIAVIIAIPFSFMAIAIYLFSSGATLNVITLSAIAIATGMVVDNSIIVIEKIFSHSKRKTITDEHIISSTQKVARALVASSLTTIVIFIPVLLLKTKSTALFIQLAGTVIVAIVSSLIVAIIFVPWCLHVTVFIQPLPSLSISLLHKLIPQFLNVTVVTSFVKKCKKYVSIAHVNSTMEYFFNNQKKLYGITLLAITSTVIPISKITVDDITFTDQNKLFARLEMPSGSSLQATSQAAFTIEKQLQHIKSINNISTRIEQEHAEFIIDTDGTINSEMIKKQLQLLPDTSLIFTSTGGIIHNEIEVIIKGRDVQVTRQLAYTFAAQLQTTSAVEDIIYHFKDERPEVLIQFDRMKCAYTGIPIAYAGDYIRNLFYSPVITKYIDDKEVDVRITNNHYDVNEINDITLPLDNRVIPLKNIATVSTSNIVTTVWHHDKMRSETISIIPKVPIHKMEKILYNTIQQLSLPDGYYIEYDKTFTQHKQSIIYMVIYICIAIALVYMVIASIFESFILPWIIIVSVPIAWMWAIWTVYIFTIQCNIATIMGFVVLTGIVVNNSILLLDSYLQHIKSSRQKKFLLIKDYHTINQHRSKPMLITTITTVSGLLPLVISSSGSHLWQGFAVTVISGLCGSFVCILIITPILFNSYQKNFNIKH